MRAEILFPVLVLAAFTAKAELVDRVAVAVSNKVITESEIALRIRLTAFQNGATPDLSIAARRKATARLIEQKLIEREMEIGHYPNLPEERAKALISEYLRGHFEEDAPGLVVALMDYALTPEDLKEDLARQADLLTFLNLRFRPAVQITEEETRLFFKSKTPVADQTEENFSGLRAAIERQLAAEHADKDLETWLAEQKKRTRIIFVDSTLAEIGVAP